MAKTPTALIILDGYGYSTETKGNAVNAANTENFDRLWNTYPHTTLKACGEAVGLPDGQMGNSEVGHQNIGAGRIVPQELKIINAELDSGAFNSNAEFLSAMEHCKENGSALHIMGLVSPGGVHSHINHLFGLLKLAKAQGLEKVFIHCFTDGRDVAPDSAASYIAELENVISETGCGRIATVSGRFYAMDRDNNFDRLQPAYDAMTKRCGKSFSTASELVKASYDNNVFDEFIIPAIVDGAQPISDNDSIIFINFRPDRALQMMKLFILSDDEMNAWYSTEDEKREYNFKLEQQKCKDNGNGCSEEYKHMIRFVRDKQLTNLHIVAMAEYDDEINNRMHIAYHKQRVDDSIGEYLSRLGYTQLRIAETEKFKHVTLFISGNKQGEFKGETRELIKSPSVRTYDLKPEMSAYEVTEKCLQHIASDKFDFIVLNYANADMVGHTGIFDAAVAAVSAVDDCLSKVVSAILEKGGRCIITADHGNADEMLTKKGKVSTQHSLNPVPLIVVDPTRVGKVLKSGGGLCDIAPTILDLMKLAPPPQMTGTTLFE